MWEAPCPIVQEGGVHFLVLTLLCLQMCQDGETHFQEGEGAEDEGVDVHVGRHLVLAGVQTLLATQDQCE